MKLSKIEEINTDTLETMKVGLIYLNCSEKNLLMKNIFPANLSLRNEGEIQTFPDKQNPRELISTRPAL